MLQMLSRDDPLLQPAPELPGYTIIARAQGDLAREFALADSHLRRITGLAQERDAHIRAAERGMAKLGRHIVTVKRLFVGRIEWHTARLAEWAAVRRPLGKRKKHVLPCGEVGFVARSHQVHLNAGALTLLIQQGRGDWLFEAGIATYKLMLDNRRFLQQVETRDDGSVILKATGEVIEPVQIAPAASEGIPWSVPLDEAGQAQALPLWIEREPAGERLALKVHTGDLDMDGLWEDLDEPGDMNTEEDDNGNE